MVKRQRAICFPDDYEIDFSQPVDDPRVTYSYFNNALDSVGIEKAYVITIDGLLQILISNNIASIVDGGSRLNQYSSAHDNLTSFNIINVQEGSTSQAPQKTSTKKAKYDIDKDDDVLTRNVKPAIVATVTKILKDVKVVRVCIVSHCHPDHLNLLPDILETKEVGAFVLGGAPYEYVKQTAGITFLQFISKYCKSNTAAKVFSTILNEDLSDKFISDTYMPWFSVNIYETGYVLSGEHNFLSFMSSISYSRKPVECPTDGIGTKNIKISEYLETGSIKLTLFSVNAGSNIRENSIYLYEHDNVDAQCFIVLAEINNVRIAFTGDSNVREQTGARRAMQVPPHVLLLSQNSQETKSTTLKQANTIESLQAWNPDVFAIPVSNNDSNPKMSLLEALLTAIKYSENSTELEMHRIIVFLNREHVQSREIEIRSPAEVVLSTPTPEPSPTVEPDQLHSQSDASKSTQPSPSESSTAEDLDQLQMLSSSSYQSNALESTPPAQNLRPRKSKKVILNLTAYVKAFFDSNQLQVSSPVTPVKSKEGLYRVFLETTLPIITIGSPLSIQFKENECMFYQDRLKMEDDP